jgi:PBSX family phage terminase large subunit
MSFFFSLLMAIVIASGSVEATPDNRPYEPIGAALTAFYSRAPEVLLSGPAGSGKTRSILEKLHLCASKYAGMRGVIVRKTRSSLSESGLVTFEEKVLPAGSRIKGNTARRYRQLYEYPNGSEIVVAGMDNPDRIMSTEFDMAVVLEATELTETDWENLTTRLRNFVMPYQQLLADCNPGSPSHWLKARADRGVLLLLPSVHEDNPTLFNRTSCEWTEAGRAYLAKLENLTGVRRLRLLKGLWAMAEGMVYGDVWNPAIHLIDRFEIPEDWPRILSVDFGYTNPFVCQWWAEDHDGRLYRYREIYQTRRLVEDHAREILGQMAGEPALVAVITDHDAEDRATLERHLGFGTHPAIKSISDGIQAVASRMKIAGDGRARIFLMRDSLVARDPDLVERKLPTCTEEEIESYIWDEKKDLPVKRDDHGCDSLRYACMWAENSSQGVYV